MQSKYLTTRDFNCEPKCEGSTVFETLKGFVETEIPPLAIPTKTEFVESLVQKCYQILTEQNCAISPDPYEVYKDEEGFDYVFMK